MNASELASLSTPVPHSPGAVPLAGVSIVLPCHDEAPNVVEAVHEASAAGRRHALAHEVIVVDDGSDDDTRAIATRLAAADPTVRVVVHPHNLGYGAALRSGIAAARQPWVLLTDADLQFDLDQLGELLPLAQEHDVIVGYRIDRQDPRGRIVAAAAWNWLVHLAFELHVRDVDCAFKLIRRDLLRQLQLEADGAMISTELLVHCLQSGARLGQLGVRHRPRQAGRQSGTSPRVVARAFRELVALRLRLGPVRVADAGLAAPQRPPRAEHSRVSSSA
jgi:Glycosyl transferase family 2